MTTWLISHPLFQRHDTGDGHPECAARLRSILSALEHPDFASLVRVEAEPATDEELMRVHDADYVAQLLASVPQRGYLAIDADTIISPDSGDAARHAAGAVRQGVDAVLGGETTRVFCAVRPPGHHAEPAQAMGFCLFNNVAVGALHARVAHGVERVAVVDFDVHHGNGTQAMLAGRDGFLYASTHQSPLFPGSGRRSENRPGRLCNIPLDPGAGSDAFRRHFRDEIVPELQAFSPQLMLVSAGFDAHHRDPLAGLALDESDYAWATQELIAVADNCNTSGIVSTLEGGYDLGALAASAAAHVRALMR